MMILENCLTESQECENKINQEMINKSMSDTLEHRRKVQEFIGTFSQLLKNRADCHDQSKLEEPEVSTFAIYGPKLKGLSYGSEEYEECRRQMGLALDHHYKSNSHHPENHENGIYGMDLIDLVELFFDWYAASKRHADGDINKSIIINKERFNIDDQITQIFKNTITNMNL